MRFKSIVLIAGFLWSALASAWSLTPEELARWQQVSSGQHSLRRLGAEFYVDVPVREIPHIRMAFFNYRRAQQLGLKIPKDPKELEALMVSFFGLEVDPTGKSPKRMMATRYQDSNSKTVGSALGDGRAVWTGELELKLPDGRTVSIDFVEKGIGKTPLAWTRNPSHSDGWQQVREMVRSAIISRANTLNELDSTDDLVGFVVREPGKAARSLSVRVGNQTRMAHFRYFSDDRKAFAKMFEYVVRRDLGLPATAKITSTEVKQYFDFLVSNLADEAARYEDLDAVHGSPTMGNRTTKGSTIDLMEFWYMDADHENFRYLFDQVARSEQKGRMSNYATFALSFAASAGYPIPSSVNRQSLSSAFDTIYARKLTDLSLGRLGLSPEEIAKVPSSLRQEFLTAVTSLRKSVGSEKRRIYWNDIEPATYDMRSVFSKTLENFAEPERQTAIFKNPRRWATPPNGAQKRLEQKYLEAVDKIVSQVSPSHSPKPEWVIRAKNIGAVSRPELATGMPATPDDAFFREHEDKIIAQLESGEFDVTEIDRMINSAAEALVDRGLPERELTNFGLHPTVLERCGERLAPIR